MHPTRPFSASYVDCMVRFPLYISPVATVVVEISMGQEGRIHNVWFQTGYANLLEWPADAQEYSWERWGCMRRWIPNADGRCERSFAAVTYGCTGSMGRSSGRWLGNSPGLLFFPELKFVVFWPFLRFCPFTSKFVHSLFIYLRHQASYQAIGHMIVSAKGERERDAGWSQLAWIRTSSPTGTAPFRGKSR